uniref:Nucleolar protein 9 n=1 Tax=Hucho hucho TaxID=62062 RepID=A0A4W5MIE5_9TELE
MSMRQPCKDKWFKPNRIPNSDSSNLSTAMAKLQHQASNLRKDQHNLERLKKKAKAVCFRQVKVLADTGRTPTHPLTNGGAGGSEQSRAVSQMSPKTGAPLPSLFYIRMVVDRVWRARRVLSQPKQHLAGKRRRLSFTVQSKTTSIIAQCWSCNRVRGKCLLSCLYGRLEVYGFTIEEGQQSYSRFSPSSHCPLTITALGDSPNPSKTKNAGRPQVPLR